MTVWDCWSGCVALSGALCDICATALSDERRRPEAKLRTVQKAHPNELADSTLATVRVATYGPRLLHACLLLRRLRLLSEDLLHLSMSRHVLVHAPVHAGSLANAQVRLLEQRDALAEALLRHPAATQGCGSANGRDIRTHGYRAARLGVSTHLLNISVIASSSCCCAACMADADGCVSSYTSAVWRLSLALVITPPFLFALPRSQPMKHNR